MAWAFSAQITIDHTLCGTADTFNYPLVFDGSRIPVRALFLASLHPAYGKVTNVNGYDVAFATDAAGVSMLDFQLTPGSYRDGAGLWTVRIPTLSHTVDTVLYILIGNPAITTDQSTTAVWDTNFKLVSRGNFNGGPGNSVGPDLTSNATGHTDHGNTNVGFYELSNVPVGFPGDIDFLQDISGNNAYVDFGNPANLQITAAITIEAWLRPIKATNGIYPKAAAKVDSNNGWAFGIRAPDDPTPQAAFFGVLNGSVLHDADSAANTVPLDVWTYCVATYDGSTGTIYTNAIAGGSFSAASAIGATSQSLNIGRDAAGTGYFDGAMCEFRISNLSRSASYITAVFNNEYNPQSFMTVVGVTDFAFKQGQTYGPFDSGAQTVGFKTPVKVGDLIVVGAGAFFNDTDYHLSNGTTDNLDSLGNVYTPVGPFNPSGFGQIKGWFSIVTHAGIPSMLVKTLTGGGTNANFATIANYSNSPPFSEVSGFIGYTQSPSNGGIGTSNVSLSRSLQVSMNWWSSGISLGWGASSNDGSIIRLFANNVNNPSTGASVALWDNTYDAPVTGDFSFDVAPADFGVCFTMTFSEPITPPLSTSLVTQQYAMRSGNQNNPILAGQQFITSELPWMPAIGNVLVVFMDGQDNTGAVYHISSDGVTDDNKDQYGNSYTLIGISTGGSYKVGAFYTVVAHVPTDGSNFRITTHLGSPSSSTISSSTNTICGYNVALAAPPILLPWTSVSSLGGGMWRMTTQSAALVGEQVLVAHGALSTIAGSYTPATWAAVSPYTMQIHWDKVNVGPVQPGANYATYGLGATESRFVNSPGLYNAQMDASAQGGFALVAIPIVPPSLACPIGGNIGTVGTPYSATLIESGGVPPFTYSASGLPPGLTLNTATGVITGTPTVAGSYEVTYGVTDFVGTIAQVTCPIVISGGGVTDCSTPQWELRRVYASMKPAPRIPTRGS